MNINSGDILALSKIFVYISAVSFTSYLPILAILRDRAKAIRLCIPLSWSIQILFGYCFFIFGAVNIYAFVYFPLILAANVTSYIIIKKRKDKIVTPSKKSKWFYLLLTLELLVGLYYRFYDSIKFVAFGNPDAMAHLSMLRGIVSKGFTRNGFYPPGFHILLDPLAHLVNIYAVSRFTGPIIGFITLIGIYFLLKDRVKQSTSIFLMAILSFPLLEKFIIQTIGFFPTALTFILFAALIYLLVDTKITFKQHLTLNLIIVLALSITVPYLFVQYLLFLVFLLFVVAATYKKRAAIFSPLIKKILISIVVLVIGFSAAFVHVEIQTRLLHRGSGFPEIRTLKQADGELLVSSNYSYQEKIKLECANNINSLKKRIICNSFYSSMIAPLVNTGLDLIKIKNILPTKTLINTLSYLVTLISLPLIFISIRKRKLELLAISASTFCFGVLTTTGFFEMSDYRGRSGWYFSLLAVFLLVEIFDLLKDFLWQKTLKYCVISAILLSSVYLAIYKPMIFPRLFYPEIFNITSRILLEHPGSAAIISTRSNLASLSPSLTGLEYNDSSLKNDYPLAIVILEKKQFDEDEVYKGIVFAHNREAEKSDPNTLRQKDDEYTRTQSILNSQELSHYKLYFENENIKVYLKSAN